MTAEIVPPPIKNVQDIPARLRTLADQIEAGSYGDVKQLAWVITEGIQRQQPSVGLLGAATHVPSELHLLLARGTRFMEDNAP